MSENLPRRVSSNPKKATSFSHSHGRLIAMFQCAYCFHDFETVTDDDLSPDLLKEAWQHLLNYHPQKLKTVRPADIWTRRIPRREVRGELLADSVESTDDFSRREVRQELLADWSACD